MTINPDPTRIMTPADRRGSSPFHGGCVHPWFVTYGHTHDMLVIERLTELARELTRLVRTEDDGVTPMEVMCERGLSSFMDRHPEYRAWITDVHLVEQSRTSSGG